MAKTDGKQLAFISANEFVCGKEQCEPDKHLAE